MNRLLISTILIFLLSIGCESNAQKSNTSNFYSPQARLKFGEHLFSQQDYLRAIDEFNAYLKYAKNDTVHFKLSYSKLMLAEFNNSRREFTKLFNSSVGNPSRLYYLTSYLIEGNYGSYLNNYNELNISSNLEKEVTQKQRVVLKLLNRESLSNEYSIFKTDENKIITNFNNRLLNEKEKLPTLATVLSSILPGSGKFYLGKFGDGVLSLFTTALFTYLAVDNFQKDRSTRAWIFTGFAAFFYAGNVYGTYAAANAYNANIRISFNQDVELFFSKNNYFLPDYEFLK